MKFSAVVIITTSGTVNVEELGVKIQTMQAKVIPLVTLITGPGQTPPNDEESLLLTRMIAKQLLMQSAEQYTVEGVELEHLENHSTMTGDKN